MSYRAAIADLARPTSAQVEDFVAYVFGAHSWYKGMGGMLVGIRFAFYLDPSVGYARDYRRDGSVELVEKREGDQFFHYNEMPTARYLERFGHLAFDFNDLERPEPIGTPGSGTSAMPWRDELAWVISREHGNVRVPRDVIDVGTVVLTGVIHPLTESAWTWQDAWKYLARHPWPEESGGLAAIERLGEVVERARADPEGRIRASMLVQTSRWEGKPRHAYDVYEIVAPERERQRRGAIQTIERMLDHVFAWR